MSATLGPLGRDNRAYLVTIVDSIQASLLVLGFAPGVGGDGEGVAWQAPGVHSDAIFGQLVTLADLKQRAGAAVRRLRGIGSFEGA